MNTQFHTPSFGDEVFDLDDGLTLTPTSSFVEANPLNTNSMYWKQHQQTPTSTKRMISVHNTSDEYHTANEESFNVTSNNSMNSSIIQENSNTSNNVLSDGGGQAVNTSPTAITTGPTTMAARKQMVPLDLTEPAKPLSAYALFFRDTVSAIKQQNPTCSFQELSKIVASMWDALDAVHKGVYNKKNELARIEYLKQMRIYQQQQQLKQQELHTNANETIQTEANTSQVQQVATQPASVNNLNNQQNLVAPNNNNVTANQVTSNNSTPTTTTNASAPSDDQIRLLTEAGSVQKCTRENCNKRAIINPDWEDEYCSNECVVIHCRNVFNAWVQSNLEAKQQQQQQQQTAVNQQTTAT